MTRAAPQVDAIGGGGFRLSGDWRPGSVLILDDVAHPWPIASAALNCMYLFRSPATPIEVRLSIAFSTSSGRLMFST